MESYTIMIKHIDTIKMCTPHTNRYIRGRQSSSHEYAFVFSALGSRDHWPLFSHCSLLSFIWLDTNFLSTLSLHTVSQISPDKNSVKWTRQVKNTYTQEWRMASFSKPISHEIWCLFPKRCQTLLWCHKVIVLIVLGVQTLWSHSNI